MVSNPRRQLLSQVTALLALAGLISGCVDSEAVTVRKSKLFVEKHEFPTKPDAPQQEGNSHWEFKFQPDIVAAKVKGSRDASGYSGVFKVKKIEVHLALPFDMWVRKDASQKAIDHQDGYVRICRHIYRDAAHVARKAAIHQMGKEIEGRGNDEEDAKLNAVATASREMREFYKDKIIDPTDRAVAAYRRLTQNGSNDMPISDAIAKAVDSTQ